VLNSNEIFTDSIYRFTTTPTRTTTTTSTRATTKKDKCKYYNCLNGGTCSTGYNGDIKCICKSNYYGDFCEKSNFFLNIILNFT